MLNSAVIGSSDASTDFHTRKVAANDSMPPMIHHTYEGR